MRTAGIVTTIALLLGGAVPASAQDAKPDWHHPAAVPDGGGSMPVPAPDAKTSPPTMMPRAPGAGGMMDPEMARMMPMMENMCATMLGGGGKGMMARRHGEGMPMVMEGPTDPVMAAFAAINRRMHEAMAVDASRGADQAFAEAMIAHHQGGIDMAKVILGFGSDPKMRSLAEQMIKAQEAEVTIMRQWLAEQPQP